MIQRINKDNKDAVMIYLRSSLVHSLRICSAVREYGVDGDELYVYADFWSDGEIKYVFAVFEGTVTVFSTSDEVDILDIYVYLRDNFIGYMAVTGEEKKVREFMRHTLFRQRTKLDVFLANSSSFREPDFHENEAVPAHVSDADELMELISHKVPQTVKISKDGLINSIKKYGAFIVRDENDEISSAAIVEDKAGRMAQIGIYSLSKEMKREQTQMVAAALTSAVIKKKYACCCRTAQVSEKQLLKSMGFQNAGTDLYLSR